jgi:predicted transcriptional regulator
MESEFINPNKAWRGFTMPFWLYEVPGLSSSAKLLYARLAYLCHENGVAWPSQEQLAGEMGVTTRTIQNLVAELNSFNLVVAQKQVIKGVTRNVYFFKDAEYFSSRSRKNLRHGDERMFVKMPKESSVEYKEVKTGGKTGGNVNSEQHKVAGAKTEAVSFVHFKKLLRSKVNMEAAHRDLRAAIVEFIGGLEGKVELGGAALTSYINELANEINTVIADEKDFSVKLVQSCVGKKKIFGSKIGLLKYAAFNPYGSIAFRDAWAKWLDYRAQHKIKSYASPDSMNAVIRKHAELCGTEAAFIQSIEQSIANTWQGLFVPKKSQAAGPVRYTSGIEKETNIYNMARKLAGLPDVYPDTNQKQIT